MSNLNQLQIGAIREAIQKFTDEREWGQFHSPKNLSMALSTEAGELLELFQWLTEAQSYEIMSDPKKAQMVKDELADVFYYLVRLADVLGINLEDAVWTKLRKNVEKYPVDLSRGNSKKYTEFEQL